MFYFIKFFGFICISILLNGYDFKNTLYLYTEREKKNEYICIKTKKKEKQLQISFLKKAVHWGPIILTH